MIILNIFNSTSCIHQVKRLVIKACVSIFIMPEFMSRGIQKYHLCPLFVWNVSPKGSAICVSSTAHYRKSYRCNSSPLKIINCYPGIH